MAILTAVYLHLAFFVSEVVFCILFFAFLPELLSDIINSFKCGFSRYDFEVVWSAPKWWIEYSDKVCTTSNKMIKKIRPDCNMFVSTEEGNEISKGFTYTEGILTLLIASTTCFCFLTIAPPALIYGALFLIGLSLKYAWWLWLIGVCGYLIYRYAGRIISGDSVRKKISAMEETIASLQSELSGLRENSSDQKPDEEESEITIEEEEK